ncbi:MAG: ATP-binding protein [Nitrospiraceae bacterium]|nr:ATP-binding protein [Nitrospiraceae bacterium]
MPLKKKIALSFFISASIIAALAVYEYVNFVQITNEIRYLEIADSLRSRALRLRRHEKNFFLYGPLNGGAESAAVRNDLAGLRGMLGANVKPERAAGLDGFRKALDEYSKTFSGIESGLKEVSADMARMRPSGGAVNVAGLLFYEHPLQAAALLEKEGTFPGENPAAVRSLVSGLKRLDSEITALRKSGEDLLSISNGLDRKARGKADGLIRTSKTAILVFFPLFLVVGLGALFVITSGVVRRLKLLISVVERTGRGDFKPLADNAGPDDEVGVLISKFNEMEDRLGQREEELAKKNNELLQSRKLAAIGTFASGVAHEINNPLNNIHLSTQVLSRELKGDAFPAMAGEAIKDIQSQTQRVKRIVGGLLDFAREGEPRLEKNVEPEGLIREAFRRAAAGTEGVGLEVGGEKGIYIQADPEQLERVFINLFTNSIEAMEGRGRISVRLESQDGENILIKVSDTGPGVPGEYREKIFEPFFTARERGTGLGLAIVFGIIKKHGGEISLERKSPGGKGAAFLIKIPGGRRT